ncbi:MAG TPA: hypothetical protein VIL85_14055 [Thermomicrobiales bacterium]|jgi:hypothetical protein
MKEAAVISPDAIAMPARGTSRLRIVVLGYIVRGPWGGMAWHHLQYVLGLARLGHDVLFLEDSDDYPSCYDPDREMLDTDPAYGLRFASRAFDAVGLGDRWTYYDAHTDRWFGVPGRVAREHCRNADLVLNLSGVNPLRPWTRDIACRVFVDTDPGFTQIRHLTDPSARSRAALHTTFFTFGERVGREGCAVPDDGFPWQPTRQPIVMEAWPVTPGNPTGRFTTVMQWDSYPAREFAGRHFGMKSASFGAYLELPALVGNIFELAIGSATVPRDLLQDKGWMVRDPLPVTRDLWTYQRFIQRSKGEFTVAKHGYVMSHSGWFSERSACYLASGRPVVTQDTGFGQILPTGMGLFAFNSIEQVTIGLDAINADYDRHVRAAREIAEAYFRAERVLGKLLAVCGL